MIKTEKKEKKIIKNANLRFAALRDCYETLLLIIDDINKELTNEYEMYIKNGCKCKDKIAYLKNK